MYIQKVCGRQPWKSVKNLNKTKSSEHGRVKRIVKGDEADYGEWPWKVQLLKRKDSE